MTGIKEIERSAFKNAGRPIVYFCFVISVKPAYRISNNDIIRSAKGPSTGKSKLIGSSISDKYYRNDQRSMNREAVKDLDKSQKNRKIPYKRSAS